MLFKQELRHKMLEVKKTQTRRPVKDGEYLKFDDQVIAANGRIKRQVGHEYAVQYGRGKPTCWWRQNHAAEPIEIPYSLYTKEREQSGKDWQAAFTQDKGWKQFKIEIIRIRREDVRNISHEDAIAEGFSNRHGFLETWCGFYDAGIIKHIGKEWNALPIRW